MADTNRFCTQCGASVQEDDVFCASCGFQLAQQQPVAEDNTYSSAAPVDSAIPIASAATVATVNPATSAATPPTPSKKMSTKRIVVIACAVILGVALIAGGIYFYQKTEYDKQHKTYPVSIIIAGEGYDASKDSPIPMKLSGVDFEGNSVEINFLYSGQEYPAEAMRGKYTIAIVSTPITKEGGIYNISEAHSPITIEDESVSPKSSSTSSSSLSSTSASSGPADNTMSAASASLKITPIDPLDATDDQLKNAYNGLIEAGVSKDQADAYYNAAVLAHTNAVEAKKAADAAVDRAEHKQSFQMTLDMLNSDSDWTKVTGNPPQGASTEIEGLHLKGYTDLEDLVFEYLGTILTSDEYAAVQRAQTSFESDVTKGAEEEMKIASSYLGGNGSRLEVLDYLKQRHANRVQELINMIP